MNLVIDTNVLAVADGRAGQADEECVAASVGALQAARGGTVWVDEDLQILDEYRRNVGPPGAGFAFFKWLFDNQANPDRCRRVAIHPRGAAGDFEEFPEDNDLAGFDYDDRKFVAVARASGVDAEIVNSSDTDWWHHRAAFERHGIRIRFLCPQLMNDDA
ncbi:MAG: hypothetical protein KJ067_20155 [Vicinamibacteria bacterium]|nr:hypothetical protein [Vicinamibacteria bacterium]